MKTENIATSTDIYSHVAYAYYESLRKGRVGNMQPGAVIAFVEQAHLKIGVVHSIRSSGMVVHLKDNISMHMEAQREVAFLYQGTPVAVGNAQDMLRASVQTPVKSGRQIAIVFLDGESQYVVNGITHICGRPANGRIINGGRRLNFDHLEGFELLYYPDDLPFRTAAGFVDYREYFRWAESIPAEFRLKFNALI